ncbi:hypothetical protein V2J09_019194 [Rumex salicifolius]
MATVVSVLDDYSIIIPSPLQPAFYIQSRIYSNFSAEQSTSKSIAVSIQLLKSIRDDPSKLVSGGLVVSVKQLLVKLEQRAHLLNREPVEMAMSLVVVRSSASTARILPNTAPIPSSSIAKTFPFSAGSKFGYNSPPLFKCRSSKNEVEDSQQLPQEKFPLLESDAPWEIGDVWSTMGLYLFSLHIPLSFGGLSVVAGFLHQPDLAPDTKALSVLVIQSVELLSTLILLQFTSKPEYGLVRLLKHEKLNNERNWLLASLLGFMLLLFIIFLTSYLADSLIGTKDVNNPALKEILSSSSVSKTACITVYCIITPVLEELVYRRFLLTSLASTMKWQQALIISSFVFSAAHLSGENFLQLFVIGCVLGCTYCWSGDLRSSMALHSMYNAFTLLVTFLA